MKKTILSALCLLLSALSVIVIAQKKNKTVTTDKFAGLDTAFERVLKDWHAAGGGR